MTHGRANIALTPLGQTVAVVASTADLKRATLLRRMPGFFELRLDALFPVLPEVIPLIAELRAPRIITARHPREGGLNNLSAAVRRKLLLQFLLQAACIDVELRSIGQMSAVWETAAEHKVARIISVHELRGTPTVEQLEQYARSADTLGADILKIATRTDTAEDWARLSLFFDRTRKATLVSAMGFGKFGRISRISLARRGSALNYVHLGKAAFEGPPSLQEMRRILRTLPATR